MNRNIFDKIISWNNSSSNKALLLTGAPGTGKTYLSQELAKKFYNSYLYLNPKHDYKLRKELINLASNDTIEFNQFLQDYYRIPNEWLNEFLIILDDFDWFKELQFLLEKIRTGKYKRILFCGTGALLSPTSTQQGLPIPGTCHAVSICGGN